MWHVHVCIVQDRTVDPFYLVKSLDLTRQVFVLTNF